MHWPPLPTTKYSWYLFLLEADSISRTSSGRFKMVTQTILHVHTLFSYVFHFFFSLSVSFWFYGFCTFLTLTNKSVASSLVTLMWLQDQLTEHLDQRKVCLTQHITNIGCEVGCTCRINSPHHSQSIQLPCRNSVNINLPCMQQCTGCPTTYQTRQFLNNFTTNKDIATKFEANLAHCVRNMTTS